MANMAWWYAGGRPMIFGFIVIAANLGNPSSSVGTNLVTGQQSYVEIVWIQG
jgi:hypothetical protein